MTATAIRKLSKPTQAQIDEYDRAVIEAGLAAERLSNLAATMQNRMAANGVEEIVTTSGRKYKLLRNENRQVNAPLLRSLISPAAWRAVTNTVVSLAAVDGAIKTGLITADQLGQATTVQPSRPFLRSV